MHAFYEALCLFREQIPSFAELYNRNPTDTAGSVLIRRATKDIVLSIRDTSIPDGTKDIGVPKGTYVGSNWEVWPSLD